LVLLGLLIGLVALAIPVAVIILLVDVASLRRRVRALELERLAVRTATPPESAPAEAAAPPAPAEPEAEPRPEAGPRPAPAAELAPEPEALGPEPLAEPAAPKPAVAPTPWKSIPEPPPPPPPPREPSGFDRFLAWLRENWFYAISAVSLGLAGIFLVQYGIETGLLTPTMRVLAALAFGAALVVAGETIRRRSGDSEETATAYLPSTFSGAGLVVLYAAILAARALYGLIGPEVTFAGLIAVALLAVVFGWFYGPFLAAGGLTGAAVAPFLVGGDAESGTLFYVFYGLLGASGLAIDAMRRWGWVSALALALSYGMGSLVLAQGGEFAGYAALMVWLALAAMALPRLELWPSHPGWTILESLERRPREGENGVIPPTRIAAGAMLVSSVLLFLASQGAEATEVLLALFLFTGLALAPTLWAARARGLADLALLPAGAFVLLVFSQAADFGALYRDFALWLPAEHPEETPPLTVTLILALAAVISLSAAWRSFRGPYPALWAAAASVFAPAMAIVLELFWHPAPVIGAYFWAGHAIALAALMTLFAARFAAADGEDRRRAAYATLAALTLIALSLFILLAEAALTVALAVLVAAAAALDRRFRLPEMHWFHLAGVATLGWRLTIDPGLPAYLEDAPLWEVLLAYGAALAGLGTGLALLPEGRRNTRVVLESALWAYGGLLATILLWRAVLELIPTGTYNEVNHWSAALFGLTWSFLALAQLYRLNQVAELRWLRRLLALAFSVLATVAFLASLTILNPAVGFSRAFGLADPIFGIQPLDTLTLAYAVPGALFAALAARARWLAGRATFAWISGLFFAVWAFLEIRWFWQGDAIASGRFSQPELYSYTVALLVAGGVLLYQAIARASRGLRRLAITVIALAIAKVFLIDISGLTGLLRVFSFLALGLVLAGLAWLNRWAAGRQVGDEGGG
jgi:uncharacterized membrane protein